MVHMRFVNDGLQNGRRRGIPRLLGERVNADGEQHAQGRAVAMETRRQAF